jgi:AcrR family transcriptional regulator
LTRFARARTLRLHVTSHDADSTQTSRGRLLGAGKTLFSRNGYEQTSTAAIAREAGSSESQLIRYFGGKAGLLEAVFNDAWSGLNEAIQRQLDEAAHGRDAIVRILGLVLEAFGRDNDIAFLFLFEGRRMRGGSHEVLLSKGFVRFTEVMLALIVKGQQDGSFRNDVPPTVLASAMLGCAEGMMRDRVLADRNRLENPFDEHAVRIAFVAMVNGLAP